MLNKTKYREKGTKMNNIAIFLMKVIKEYVCQFKGKIGKNIIIAYYYYYYYFRILRLFWNR